MKNNIPQEEPKQEYEYIGECNGNNDNGCFLDSCGHDCGCFERVLKQSKKETHICKYCGAETTQPDDECYAKPKQETLEEAAERIFREPFRKNLTLEEITIDGKDAVNCMLSLADWQAERSYSKEDMKQAFFDGIRVTGGGYNGEYASGNHPDIEVEFYESYIEWFKQFKKK
jgi:hypothetical protein